MKHLFIDRAYIERLDGLERVFHRPRKHPEPVLAPDQPWEDVRLHLWNAPQWCPQRRNFTAADHRSG